MGSTNKTQYLELPQWIGTDQPTWLGDMNDAFLKIDTGYNTVNGDASSAISQAGQAVQTANNANTAATTAQETAESADSKATTAANTANSALEVANSASSAVSGITNKVTTLENQFKGFSTWIEGTLSNTPSAWTVRGNMVNYNDDLSLLNITYRITGDAPLRTELTLGKLPANIVGLLQISSPRTIWSGAGVYFSGGANVLYTDLNLTISTNGTITVAATSVPINASQITINLMLCTAQW